MPLRSRFATNCSVAARKWPTSGPGADTRSIFSAMALMAESPSSRCAPILAMSRPLRVRFGR
jgi:hypothetical protein